MGHSQSGLFFRLGIRSSLLLGFGTIIGIMALSVIATIYFSAHFNTVVSHILTSKLPVTVHTFRVARAADDLAASALSLGALNSKEERDVAFKRINKASHRLDNTLKDLRKVVDHNDMIPTNLFAKLKNNLRHQEKIVDKRIKLRELHEDAKTRLLSNILVFQRYLIYRTRILEGDGEVINQMMKRPSPPADKVAAMAVDLTRLLPVARFYTIIEYINGRLLMAGQSPTIASLNTSRQELIFFLKDLNEGFENFPDELKRELTEPLEILNNLILSENGLVQLREKELQLLEAISTLNTANQSILVEVNTATEQMVNNSQNEMSDIAENLAVFRKKSMMILLFLAGAGFLCVTGLMHFYVNRQIIAHLSWVSFSMLKIADGHLDIDLPPAGSTELGRLGVALKKFSKITSEARIREEALQASNDKVQEAMVALEEKTRELEIANRKLTELSIKDPMTGLFNRRYFDETLKHEWHRSARGGKPIGFILLDVDNFKAFNDIYGHQAGDECLKKVASALMKHARRAGDVAARYGGEEFCMICPYTDTIHAKTLAESIRSSIEDMELLHKGSSFGVVTVSIGYIALQPNEKSTSYQELLHMADIALYKAKSSGRNCIRTIPPEQFGI